MKFCAFLLALTVGAESKNILLVAQQITSHFFEMNGMSSGLVKNGHEVYVTISKRFPKADKVLTPGIKPLYFDPLPETLSTEWIAQQYFDVDYSVIGYNMSRSVLEDCTAMMQDVELNGEIKRIGFDLAIVDGSVLSYCGFLLPYIYEIPYVLMHSSTHPWVAGVPALPSFSPLIQAAPVYSDKMTFWQRVENLFYYIFMYSFIPLPGRYNMSLLQEYASDVTTWEALVYESELFIITRDHLLEKPSPSMPNYIQTPGITVSPPKPLPKDLEAIMAGAHKGVVLVSFGSIAGNFPDSIIEKLINAFNQLEETVIWKFSGKSLDRIKTLTNKNVHLLPWIPQNDLLGNPQTKVFVTHCGNNGQYEAVYHAVPMVGVPVFADQFHNAFRQADKGYGLSMLPGGLMDFTVDDLVSAVKEVAKNRKYKEAIQRASNILKDNPMDPTETATYWLEHVMKFGGSHLRSHGVNMPWYQYFMFDIMLLLVVVLHVIGYISFIIVSKVIRTMFCSKKKSKVA